MPDSIEERTVILQFPKRELPMSSARQKDREMWLSMLLMLLESEFTNYRITVTEEKHANVTVEIVFSTIDDAMLFRLQH
jgi:hypothetical protein